MARQFVDGKYELVELAGEGGMASVWRAVMHGAAGFTRQVAVKKIKSEYRAIRNYIDMFVEEARVGSDLAHPNIVQVFDFCTDDEGAYYLVMEWVEGMDLGTFIRSFRDVGAETPWPLIVAMGIGALRGLGAAHERQRPDGTVAPVIHRDVSPHNILLGVNGVVKLTDFGLARARDRVFSLTAPGTVKGKLSYLSPEVTLGKPASPQSDLFAMGSVLWEALSGSRLFDARTDLEVFKQIRNCEIRPLAPLRPDLPAELIAAVDRALSKDPAHRFGSARAMAFALAEILRYAPAVTDAQQALGSNVLDARKRLGARARTVDDSQPTQDWKVDGKRPTRPPIAPGLPPERPAPMPPGPPGPNDGSIDVEFSSPEIGVDPMLLTQRKKP
jgi:serine/threonine protein kinase